MSTMVKGEDEKKPPKASEVLGPPNDREDPAESAAAKMSEKDSKQPSVLGQSGLSKTEAKSVLVVVDQQVESNDKRDLMKAQRRVPQLVTRESDPSLFLRASDGNAERAARRLARYWSKRVEVFGRERAFLPMTQTGTGCLMKSGVEQLKRNEQWTVLPNDSAGRTVFFLDCSKGFEGSLQERSRCLFYLLSVAVSNTQSQTHGVVVLAAMPEDPQDLEDSAITSFECFLGLLMETMPLSLHAIHFVAISKESDTMETLQEFCDNMGVAVRSKAKVHVADSGEAMAQQLEGENLPKRSLPRVLGGLCDSEYRLRWHTKKEEEENNKYSPKETAANQTAALARPGAANGPTKPISPKSAPAYSTNSQEEPKDEETRKRFLRKRNALYARRKYARRKIETEVRREQCVRLESQNQALKAEGKRLESLIERAEQMASICDTFMQRERQQATQALTNQATTLVSQKQDTSSAALNLLSSTATMGAHLDRRQQHASSQQTSTNDAHASSVPNTTNQPVVQASFSVQGGGPALPVLLPTTLASASALNVPYMQPGADPLSALGLQAWTQQSGSSQLPTTAAATQQLLQVLAGLHGIVSTSQEPERSSGMFPPSSGTLPDAKQS